MRAIARYRKGRLTRPHPSQARKVDPRRAPDHGNSHGHWLRDLEGGCRAALFCAQLSRSGHGYCPPSPRAPRRMWLSRSTGRQRHPAGRATGRALRRVRRVALAPRLQVRIPHNTVISIMTEHSAGQFDPALLAPFGVVPIDSSKSTAIRRFGVNPTAVLDSASGVLASSIRDWIDRNHLLPRCRAHPSQTVST